MATIDRRGNVVSATDPGQQGGPNPGLGIKAPVRAATTAAITLSGLQTIDAVALAAGDRVLVKNQADPKQNGIYNASTGNWTRAIDAAGNSDWANGTVTYVALGTSNGDKSFIQTAPDPVIIGTSLLTFLFVATSGIPAARQVATTAPLAGGGDLSADRTLSLTIGATLAVVGGALQTVALTGDVTAAANSFATTIGANAVTYDKFQNIEGLALVGNAGTMNGNVHSILGIANQIPIINNGGSALAFTTISGDITNVTGVFTIGAGAVSYAKIQNETASTLLGNPSGISAAPAEITLGATLTFSGTSLRTAALTGDVTAAANSFVTTVAKIAGTTVSGTTGSGNVVFSASPTLSGTVAGALTFSGTHTLSAALTYGGVTLSNSVTGTGSMALSASPIFTGTVVAPTIAGGSAAGSSLTLESTSGAGTTDSIVFQTGSQVFAGSINTGQQWLFGTNHAPIANAVLTVSKNAATAGGYVGSSTPLVHLVAADSVQPVLLFDGYGGVGKMPFIITRNANGTAGSFSATLSGDQVGFFGMVGAVGANLFAAADGSKGGVFFGGVATENWSPTNQGTKLILYATPTGTNAISAIMTLNTGVQVGAPTGGDKGAGTINVATNVFLNGTSYTNPDFVFEHAYRGKIERFADRPGAADYAGLMPLPELRRYTRSHLRLPGIKDEPTGIFTMADIALAKIEELTLYVLDLHERLETRVH